MKTIHKYQVDLGYDHVSIDIPRGGVFLSAHAQEGKLCVWARVDTDQPSEPRTLRIVGTGHPAPDGLNTVFIGTVLLFRDSLVLHVFEEVKGGAS